MIISILGHRNAGQRKSIRHAYAETYGQDLLKDLDKELSSDFEVDLHIFLFYWHLISIISILAYFILTRYHFLVFGKINAFANIVLIEASSFSAIEMKPNTFLHLILLEIGSSLDIGPF